MGFAVNNATNLHLFMQQTAKEHSGNIHTTGPKPPMLAIPDRQPFGENKQLAFNGFIEQLVLDTGWQPGAPTNLWLVGYNQTAGQTVATDTLRGTAAMPMNSEVKTMLEQALSCTTIVKRFDVAEAALKRIGWSPESGIATIVLPEPLRVYGLTATKLGVSRDGFEHVYRSYLPGVSKRQAIKAASLKLGKDGRSYGRATKTGVLTVAAESGETTLTCTVDTEGMEG